MGLLERALHTSSQSPRGLKGSVTNLSSRSRRSEASRSDRPEQGASVSPLPRPRGAAGTTAVLDIERLVARGFVPPDGTTSRVANEFRVIKRALIANALGKTREPVPNGRRILVTSSRPEEGKTFCAINLALSMAAERDLGVLLVDADVARPSVQRALRLAPGVGLMDLLENPALDPASTVRPTNVEGLSILTAGTVLENANEWLASSAMNRLLETLSEQYPDHILIFDAPPLLHTTEARVLASAMGQTVLVVEAGVTPQGAIEEALGLIDACPVVGLLLNKADTREAWGYGDLDAYGYGRDGR